MNAEAPLIRGQSAPLNVLGAHVESNDETFSAYDYFTFDPGDYVLYSVSDWNGLTYNLEDVEVERVVQYSQGTHLLTTLNKVGLTGGYWRDCLFLWTVMMVGDPITGGSNSLLISNIASSGNQGSWWKFVNAIPVEFHDGQQWSRYFQYNDEAESIVTYLISHVGDIIIDGNLYKDCIHIQFNHTFLRCNNDIIRDKYDGNGEFYLSKGIGLIKFIFQRSERIFTAKIKDYGKLLPITLSGVLTIDGITPAKGYYVGLTHSGIDGLEGHYGITDDHGIFSFQAFGNSIRLICGGLLNTGGLNFTNYEEYKIYTTNFNKIWLRLKMDLPYDSVTICLDEIYRNKGKCDFNETITFNIHYKYLKTGLGASGIKVSINDNTYKSNYTGWINFIIQTGLPDNTYLTITNVSNCNVYGITFDYPYLICNKVAFHFDELIRCNIGTNIINYTATYLSDNSHFEGSIILNDTLRNKELGKYSFKIMGISDTKYGLKSFTANDFQVIFDRVNLELSISDDRIDIGEEPEIAVSGIYEYDSQPFYGQVGLGSPPSLNKVGDFIYTVESIADPQYCLTAFTSNNVTCIWDRIKVVEGGVSKETAKVGEPETVWFKVVYEYDNQVFDGSKGTLYVNAKPMEWSSSNSRWEKDYTSEKPQTISFEVTGVQDDEYGLTTINNAVGSLSIEWKPQGIPCFSCESIMLGLALGIFLLWMLQRRQ